MADADLSLYLSVPIAQPQPPEFQKLLFPQQHLLWLHFQVTVYLAYENKGGHIIRGLQEEIQREAQRAVLLCIPFCISQFRLVVQSRTKLWLRPRVLWNNRLESDPSFMSRKANRKHQHLIFYQINIDCFIIIIPIWTGEGYRSYRSLTVNKKRTNMFTNTCTNMLSGNDNYWTYWSSFKLSNLALASKMTLFF